MTEIFHQGGPVMYPLLLCSILVVTVIIERTIFWLQIDLARNRKLMDEVLKICQDGNWKMVRQKVTGSKDYIIRVLISGIVHREFSMQKAMEAAAIQEIKHMRRFMGVLDTMITVAPLLGIFGTVIGIINAFQSIGMSGSASLAVVAPG
ncbi:MAG: MotA/TolQ/ExbB proton channel family protein, partial [Desulfobacula sp.]|nr:MotA/TolQ/ExbB proton channel family protein [Desulfobacula sp.]